MLTNFAALFYLESNKNKITKDEINMNSKIDLLNHIIFWDTLYINPILVCINNSCQCSKLLTCDRHLTMFPEYLASSPAWIMCIRKLF